VTLRAGFNGERPVPWSHSPHRTRFTDFTDPTDSVKHGSIFG
jgi:hypothetical protein